MRWKIETFHKILKSGLKIEELRLRTAGRLTNLIALCCIVSWRIFRLTSINRTTPEERAESILTCKEIQVLQKISKNKSLSLRSPISDFIVEIAKLGGYLGRASDPPLGHTVLWRGISRLHDIIFGIELAADTYG
jgi:hypothetical protein